MSADTDASHGLPLPLPAGKHDLLAAQAIVAAGYPAVQAQLPALLTWMQDINWPVARVLAPFLASIGKPLAPPLAQVFESNDAIWTCNVLTYLVSACPPLAIALEPQLSRLAARPTQAERDEGVDDIARQILATLPARR
ncbi:DUF5071 domain-containing protein [Achromobacter sp. UMC71]|uniref:DUF5071 domain-containing protein n=1 Tax=Achromobacter sp. UMC71 TaxID=1862320 RepID=UPI001601C01E|nr:DUF5071 domain-containing protein [Achromobacter sp. UMC71]